MTMNDALPEFLCPICGGALVIAPSDVEQIAACPLCHEDITIPARTDSDDAAFAFERACEDVENRDDDQLDARRIQQQSTLRRAVYRSRSYAIIAAIVCAVATIQLAQFTYRAVQVGYFGWASFYVLLLAGSVLGTVYSYRCALSAHREAARRDSNDSSIAQPDFSTLSDGSQQLENLNDVR